MVLNQLSEIEKLFTKPKEYKIPLKPKKGEPQATITIRSLAMDEMSYFDIKKEDSIEQQSQVIAKLLAISMSIEVEQAKKLSISSLMDLMKCITDANNLEDEEKKDKLDDMKQFINSKKKQNESRTAKSIKE